MGIWDKIKKAIGIADYDDVEDDGTEENDIGQAEETEPAEDNNSEQTEETEALEESKSKESVDIEPTKEEGQEKPNIG